MRPHMVPDTHLLKLLFLTRYINCSLRLFANLLACLGEGAERSEAEGGVSASQLNIALRYINGLFKKIESFVRVYHDKTGKLSRK